jgi:hypothetical protein
MCYVTIQRGPPSPAATIILAQPPYHLQPWRSVDSPRKAPSWAKGENIFFPSFSWGFWRPLALLVSESNGCCSYFPTKEFARNVNWDSLFLRQSKAGSLCVSQVPAALRRVLRPK